MDRKHNKSLVPIARNLRKHMTKEEKRIWYDFLREHPLRFTRQKIIGLYIADFYSAKLKMIIEIDGSQHQTQQERIKDEARTTYFQRFGLSVLRISNDDINTNFDAVCSFLETQFAKHQK